VAEQNHTVATFDTVADEYDSARPSYPPAVYESLGDLDGRCVLDVGAGTGIATRQLLERGARVVAVDPGQTVLIRAIARTSGLPAVVADGAQLPIQDQTTDLVCFAQSWHWLDEETRVQEVHRVLRDGGRWAGWWSHARADTEDWFDEYWSAIEASCPGTHRDQRNTDWGATVDVPGMFTVAPREVVPWTRSISTEEWLTDQASHSYVAALGAHDRRELLAQLQRVVEREFPAGTMTVRYETWLWTATRTPDEPFGDARSAQRVAL
jgi:SAM-dependent methyltransferase